jgi:hypothetical protein
LRTTSTEQCARAATAAEEKEWVEKISERSVELLRAAAINVTGVVKEG